MTPDRGPPNRIDFLRVFRARVRRDVIRHTACVMNKTILDHSLPATAAHVCVFLFDNRVPSVRVNRASETRTFRIASSGKLNYSHKILRAFSLSFALICFAFRYNHRHRIHHGRRIYRWLKRAETFHELIPRNIHYVFGSFALS